MEVGRWAEDCSFFWAHGEAVLRPCGPKLEATKMEVLSRPLKQSKHCVKCESESGRVRRDVNRGIKNITGV